MNTEKSLYQSLVPPAIITIVLLLIPLVAMQFTDEVVWGTFDFVFAGGLIFGTGAAYQLITRKSVKTTYRAAIGLALISSLLLVWVNGAVGIIGSENNTVNLWYFGVIAFGIPSAVAARLKPKGMALTLFGMAFIMALIAGTALMSGAHHLPYSSVTEILGLNGFFVMLFIVSGLLFRNAAGEEEEPEWRNFL